MMSMPIGDVSALHNELRRTAISKRRDTASMYDYPKKEVRDFHREIKSIAVNESWAQSYIGDSIQGDMRSVLDELKKEKKKKKKSSSRHTESARPGGSNDEFMKLQEELKLRTKLRSPDKQSSLYGADGKFDDDSKARLEITKKDILDEIRRKSSGRRNSHSTNLDDYGLLGSTKSSVLEELKKKSKRKKRSSFTKSTDTSRRQSADDRMLSSSEPKLRTSARRHSTDDDTRRSAEPSRSSFDCESEENSRATSRSNLSGLDFEFHGRNVPGSRSPVPSSWGVSKIFHHSGSHRNEPTNDNHSRGSSDEKYKPDAPANDGGDWNEQDQYVDSEEQDEKIRSPFDCFNENGSPVPPERKESLHSELKTKFKAPSRSRALMYKYGNYDSESRAPLHQELHTRVPQVAPRAYSRSSWTADKSTVHDELKSRYREKSGSWSYSSRSLSLGGTTSVRRTSSLEQHIHDPIRTEQGPSRISSMRSTTTGGSSYVSRMSGNKFRYLEGTDGTVETQATSDSEFGHTSSAFFIPGITGTARCLNRGDEMDRPFVRERSTSRLSTVSGESGSSLGGASGGASKMSARSSGSRSRTSARSGDVARSDVERHSKDFLAKY